MIKVISIDDFDRLCEYINDIKDAISGGGGGGSGGGLPDYSTTEKKTGQKWIDEKDVWFKVVEGNLSAITQIISGTSNIDKLVQYSGVIYKSTAPTTEVCLPYYTSSTRYATVTKAATGVRILTTTQMIGDYDRYRVVLYYTKV